MSEQYIGEIRLFPYNGVPQGWMKCEGQLLAIRQYQALYSLLYTTYGGDGSTNFALPDLRGRSIIGAGAAGGAVPANPGGKGGAEVITLTVAQMPVHTHQLMGTNDVGTTANMTNGYFATPKAPVNLVNPPPTPPIYGPVDGKLVPLNSNAITNVGGNGAHENRQPFLALRYCIATEGYYPMRG